MTVVLDARVVSGSGGGPDKTILNSPRFFAPLGYRMLCAYLHPPGDPGFAEIERKAARHGAELVAIPDRGPFDWRIVRSLLNVCRRENVAIWHGHDYKTNALGLLLKRFHPMKLVTTMHGWVEITRRTPWYYRIDRVCLPRYERVYCVSEDLLTDARKCGVKARNAVLLENGIDLAGYARKQSIAEAKAALGLPADAFVIGSVGRLSPEKAFDVLIRCLPQLPANARLVIVGEGADRARLEALATELGLTHRVSFAGWQSDARPFYEAFDVFALASLREGLPNVLLEAMALGVPCVATRIAGIPRLIQDGENGRLVEAGAFAGMQDVLQTLTDDAELRRRYAEAGRRTVEERYDFAARIRALAADYDRLLRRP